MALSVTDTVTGAPVLGFVQTVNGSRATVSAPGYVTREIGASRTQTDLIPEAGFDLAFYRQMARGAQDGSIQPLRRLSQSPSVYMQSAGLSPALLAAFESVSRAAIPALTGGALTLAEWNVGPEPRAPQSGWIVVELIADESTPECGRALIGAAAGRMWLNTVPRCRRDGALVGTPHLFAHELGHALGFWHVDTPDALMNRVATTAIPSPAERHHGAIAYKRPIGSLDVDRDPVGLAILPSSIIID